jgi:hypothetical protein
MPKTKTVSKQAKAAKTPTPKLALTHTADTITLTGFAFPIPKPIDVEQVVAIIRAEQHLIHGALIETDPKCKSVGHCAVGALLAAAGFTSKQIRAMQPSPMEWNRDATGRRALDKMQTQYGLQQHDLRELVTTNDSVASESAVDDSCALLVPKGELKRRQRVVIETVKTMARTRAARLKAAIRDLHEETKLQSEEYARILLDAMDGD